MAQHLTRSADSSAFNQVAFAAFTPRPIKLYIDVLILLPHLTSMKFIASHKSGLVLSVTRSSPTRLPFLAHYVMTERDRIVRFVSRGTS